jgi:single-strand DNA-binding protein
MSVNKVILVGRCGGDAMVRMAGDKKVATINLATSEKYKGRDGNWVENTEWHCVVLWDRLAEVAEKYVTKGTQLYIEGKIKTEMYTNKEGQEKVMVRIKADNMQMLSGTKSQDNAPASAYAPKSTPLPTYDDASPSDDLPF